MEIRDRGFNMSSYPSRVNQNRTQGVVDDAMYFNGSFRGQDISAILPQRRGLVVDEVSQAGEAEQMQKLKSRSI